MTTLVRESPEAFGDALCLNPCSNLMADSFMRFCMPDMNCKYQRG